MTPGELGPELERLHGVLAATVFSDRDRTRVYLAVRDNADRDAIRATTLALLRDHGLRADPDQLHIGTAPPSQPAPTTLPPLSLDTVDVHRADSRVQCSVALRTPDRTSSGTATEPDTPDGRARAAARATLAAAEPVDPDLRFGLHGTRIHDLFGAPTVSLLIEASLGRTHVRLPGAALIDRSVEHAAALATLQALRSWTP